MFSRSPTEVPAFKDFNDFDLELSSLTSPRSPPTLISELPRFNLPRPPSPFPQSTSFSIISESLARGASLKRSRARGRGNTRLPLLLVKYIGRGTPVDRGKRLEWGGADLDRILFPNMRSDSPDSTFRPSQSFVSSDWNLPSTDPLRRRSSSLPPRRSSSTMYTPMPVIEPPEIKIEGLGAGDSEEWASFVQTVLGPAEPALVPTPELETAAPELAPLDAQEEPEQPEETLWPVHDVPFVPKMSPEEIQQLSNGLNMDLDSGAPLDLGLGVRDGGMYMNVFGLPESGRESPSSVYSTPPPSTRASSPPTPSLSDYRSAMSIQDEVGVDMVEEQVPRPWRKKMLRRFKSCFGLLESGTRK